METTWSDDRCIAATHPTRAGQEYRPNAWFVQQGESDEESLILLRGEATL